MSMGRNMKDDSFRKKYRVVNGRLVPTESYQRIAALFLPFVVAVFAVGGAVIPDPSVQMFALGAILTGIDILASVAAWLFWYRIGEIWKRRQAALTLTLVSFFFLMVPCRVWGIRSAVTIVSFLVWILIGVLSVRYRQVVLREFVNPKTRVGKAVRVVTAVLGAMGGGVGVLVVARAASDIFGFEAVLPFVMVILVIVSYPLMALASTGWLPVDIDRAHRE